MDSIWKMVILSCITTIEVSRRERGSDMKKRIRKMLFCIAVMLLGCTTVYAEELESIEKNMVLETAKEVELLEKPETAAKAVVTLQAGTPVMVVEEENNGWCKVANQGQEGYVQISALKTIGNQEELNAEFEKISNTIQLAFDEIMTQENATKQARIWGTIIVVLIVAIFGVGIVSAIKKNKLEREEGKS